MVNQGAGAEWPKPPNFSNPKGAAFSSARGFHAGIFVNRFIVWSVLFFGLATGILVYTFGFFKPQDRESACALAAIAVGHLEEAEFKTRLKTFRDKLVQEDPDTTRFPRTWETLADLTLKIPKTGALIQTDPTYQSLCRTLVENCSVEEKAFFKQQEQQNLTISLVFGALIAFLAGCVLVGFGQSELQIQKQISMFRPDYSRLHLHQQVVRMLGLLNDFSSGQSYNRQQKEQLETAKTELEKQVEKLKEENRTLRNRLETAPPEIPPPVPPAPIPPTPQPPTSKGPSDRNLRIVASDSPWSVSDLFPVGGLDESLQKVRLTENQVAVLRTPALPVVTGALTNASLEMTFANYDDLVRRGSPGGVIIRIGFDSRALLFKYNNDPQILEIVCRRIIYQLIENELATLDTVALKEDAVYWLVAESAMYEVGRQRIPYLFKAGAIHFQGDQITKPELQFAIVETFTAKLNVGTAG